MTDHYEPKRFPEGFLWGAATSAHQVEGQNTRSDWWAWEQEGGHIADGTTSGAGVDHWHRYEEDFTLAQRMHHNVHRLSIEWSRIEPEEGVWDEEAIAHYRSVLAALKQRGMAVMLTLHHFTNPLWFTRQGGWETSRAPEQFARYVQQVCDTLGTQVDFWITINEPMVYALGGYVSAEWPPQQRSAWRAARVLWQMARAHRRAYTVIHRWARRQQRGVEVGMANNVSSFLAYRKHHIGDVLLMSLMDWVSNHGFYLLTGKRTHDFLGLNYYFHLRIPSSWTLLRRLLKQPDDIMEPSTFESSDIGWELFPHGIFDVCVDMASYKKPIYITENGLATDDDDKRIRALVGYLLQVYYAIQEGADVRGYLHWSLLDNFEWAKGYQPKFGLIAVDRATMQRTPKPSCALFSALAQGNAITHDMLQLLGHGTSELLAQWKRARDQV